MRLASLVRVSRLAAVPALVTSPAFAQKNEGMGVVAPSKPILNLENLQAPSSPGSASAPASPPKAAPAPKPPAPKEIGVAVAFEMMCRPRPSKLGTERS